MSELVRGEHNWQYYNRYRGAKIYYPGHTKSIIDQILASPAVTLKIRQLSEKEKVKQSVVRARARKQAEFFVARHEHHNFIRFAAWSVGGILKSVYDQGVWVDAGEIRRLRETARVASLKKQSLIFLPCHRSHIDYVSLQILYFQLGLSLPAIVAGENLNFPLVGPFLQNAGAFWIKRESPSDETNALYNPLMASYIDTLMDRGINFELFVEGTRSRSGKMLPPKYGMLKNVCESLLRLDKDAVAIPISIQYDNVLETASYASELLGQEKTKESLSTFFQARKVLALKMGRIDARFGEAFSLRDFIHENAQARLGAGETTSDIQAFSENPTPILRALGYKVLNDINNVSVVMPTALIGAILLTIRGRGVGKSELVRKVAWLSDKIRSKGGRVASIDNYEVVIEKAIRVLGKLVGIRKDLVEDTYYAADRFQISYFRNQVIHLFISEAIICVSLYSKVKAGGQLAEQRISADDLHRQTAFLSEVLKGEFIYNTQGIEANVQAALTQLSSDGVIEIGDDHVALSGRERAEGRENYDFYCFLIWPFVETYWFAGVSLFALTPRRGGRQDRQLGKTLYYQGDLSYITAISNETLINALQYYASIGVIELVRGPRKKDARVRFDPAWAAHRDPDGRVTKSGKLWDFVDTIAISRREGKNRRDTATVGRRVLDLVDAVGAKLHGVAPDRAAKL
ncbi:putative Acyltransferase [Taphrina deformans PYCC 5710]|uniref:Acyltransferase n=1 Tax=Taphrina deformans (strain PYCC 5710 / ATCC 11124 / CBS 356.35 / IMI 108563 / JCM 9778 / NBRC 8474) TaxID=1097556 RepID=R4X743_TAPDE|nr:putative Acyltransferase [Taphrina deformans PYCC 5710]|eukprot:CCG80873.1 putative Acyltransferase [Taphrina deformans PYCC 5710]